MYNNKKFIKSFFYLLLIHYLAHNNTLLSNQNIKIKVLEKGTGKALKRVEVKYGASLFYTDQNGKLSLKITNIKKIILYKAGYERLAIKTDELREEKGTVYLYPAQPEDRTITIYGKRKKNISKKKISIREAIEVAPRGDPAQVIKLLPGVQSPFFGTQVIVRGSAPNDSKYYANDFDLPFVYHGVGQFSVIPKELLSEVEFYAGGFGPQYGEVTGGVIRLNTKDEIATERKADISINLPLYSSIFYDQPINDNSSVSLSYRRSYVDFFIKKLLEDSPTLVIPEFSDSHIQYIRRTKESTQKVLLITSSDKLTLAFPSAGASKDGKLKFNISTNFVAGGIEQKGKISKNIKYKLTPNVVYTKVYNTIQDSVIDIEGFTYFLPIETTWTINKKNKLTYGIQPELSRVNIKVDAPLVFSDSTTPNFEVDTKSQDTLYLNYRYANWIKHEIKISNFTLIPGIRQYYSSQLQEYGWDPRFRLIWDYNKQRKEKIKFAIGKYSKSPQPQETDSVFGSPNLTFEKSIHYVLGWEKDWSDMWNIDIQLYFKDNWDVVRSDKTTIYKNTGFLRSYGLEFFLRRNLTERAFGWLSYTFSKTEEKKDANSIWTPYRYDQTHNINLVASYKLSGKWSVGGRINYHTGDRLTPITGVVFDANLGSYKRRSSTKDRYSERLPNYYQVDLYTIYDFLFNKWKLKLRCGVEYLAFRQQAVGISYNYDYSKKEYLKPLPPTPFIELQGVL